jgi:ABC-2 type transport system permease protein
MSNIWIVAKTEFAQIVRTKAFIASLLMLPLMIAITVGLQTLVAAQERGKPYRVAVIDETQQLYPQLMAAAILQNATNSTSISPGPRLEIFEEKPPANLEALKLSLSEKIRNKDLEAFIVLPAGLLSQPPTVKAFSFHADETKYGFTGWFNLNINQSLFLTRLSQNGIKPERLQEIAQPTEMERAGLFKVGSAGEIQKTDKAENILQVVLPMGLMIVLFLLVMMSTQPLLSTVLEEKMSRISEVLLGLVNPFDLMMGKLIGSLGASLILAILYMGTGGALMAYMGYLSAVPFTAFLYLLLFLFPAVFLFGATYLAVGAACNDFKDAQTLLTPFMLVLSMPMIAASLVISDPNGPIATGLSLFPPATPFLMLLRVSLRPGPPIWQIPLSLFLTFATATFIVFVAGRIFRTGLLMQGKAPSIKEMIRWAMVK